MPAIHADDPVRRWREVVESVARRGTFHGCSHVNPRCINPRCNEWSGGPATEGVAALQIWTTGQVMVRVMPSICPMSRTTMRPRSFMERASARAMTS